MAAAPVDWDRRCNLAKSFLKERIKSNFPRAVYFDIAAMPKGKSIYECLRFYDRVGFMVWRRHDGNPQKPIEDIPLEVMFDKYCELYEIGYDEEGYKPAPSFKRGGDQWKASDIEQFRRRYPFREDVLEEYVA